MRRDTLGLACLSSLAFFRESASTDSSEQDVAIDDSSVDSQDAPEGSPDPVIGAVKLLDRNPAAIGWGTVWQPVVSTWRVRTSQKESYTWYTRASETLKAGMEGVETTRPDGSPRKVLLFSIPEKYQNNMAGFFPLVRGIPSAYIRSIRVTGAKKSGSVSKTPTGGNSHTSQRSLKPRSHTYQYLLSDIKQYYQRNDGLVVFKRLTINDFLDGYNYLAVVLMDGAASLSTSSISVEVWDRDPLK